MSDKDVRYTVGRLYQFNVGILECIRFNVGILRDMKFEVRFLGRSMDKVTTCHLRVYFKDGHFEDYFGNSVLHPLDTPNRMYACHLNYHRAVELFIENLQTKNNLKFSIGLIKQLKKAMRQLLYDTVVSMDGYEMDGYDV